jgi:hypothetical protein
MINKMKIERKKPAMQSVARFLGIPFARQVFQHPNTS